MSKLCLRACRGPSDASLLAVCHPRPCPSRLRRLHRLTRPPVTTVRSLHTSISRFNSPTISPVRTAEITEQDAGPGSDPASFDAPSPPDSGAAGPGSGEGGIRDRLRFWAYDNDKKKRRISLEAQQAIIARNEAAMANVQITEEDDLLPDADPEELQRYVTIMDQISAETDYHDTAPPMFQTGDIVEMAGSGPLSSRIAIFVRTLGTLYQYYTIDGQVRFSTYQTAIFRTTGRVPLEGVNAIMPFLPQSRGREVYELMGAYQDAVPRAVGAPLLRAMVDFYRQTDAAFRQYASVFDSAHEQIADPTEVLVMSLEDITSKLTGIPKDQLEAPLLLACSQTLLRGKPGFRTNIRLYAAYRFLEVESKQTVAAINRVAVSARAVQEAHALRVAGAQVPPDIDEAASTLRDFVAKARPLIEHSRAVRHYTPEGSVLTVKQQSSQEISPADTVRFSDSDKDFIQFLVSFVALKPFFYQPTLRSVAPVIVNELGMYRTRQEIDMETFNTILVEIGVLQPYEICLDLHRDLLLEQPALEARLQATERRLAAGEDVDSAADFRDSMEPLRHDFGDLAVFCIDSTDTTEVDDGISVEPVPQSPGHHWLHVHIAHPSAFIDPGSTLAQRMQSRLSTRYMSEARATMLPSWAGKRFSLHSGAPTLTTSMLIDEDCNVIETKIRAARIHNVIQTDYDTVNDIFGYENQFKESVSMRIGEQPEVHVSPPTETQTLSEEHKAALRTIHALAVPARTKRLSNAPFSENYNHNVLSNERLEVQPRSESTYSIDSRKMPDAPHFAASDPSVKFKRDELLDVRLIGFEIPVPPATLLVSECMLAANRAAADWAAARALPMAYVGTVPATGGIELEAEQLRREISAMAAGEIPYDRGTLAWFNLLFSRVGTFSMPVQHRGLGFKAYLRMTSPLRRMSDAVCHWNVNAALIEEARLGRALQPEDDKSFVPFPKAWLDEHTKYVDWRHREWHRIYAAHRKHWLIYSFARAYCLKEAPLPSPLVVEFSATGGKRRPGNLMGMDVTVESSHRRGADGNAVVYGDRWEVEVESVQPGARCVSVRPIKRILSGRELRNKKMQVVRQRKANMDAKGPARIVRQAS